MTSETLKLTPSESVTVLSSTPQALEVEATYGPGGKPPPKHLHPAQDEHFEVLAGSVRVRAGSEERDLHAGGTIEIPRETPHQMWNPGARAARVRWETRPAGRTEEWFRDVDALNREAGGGAPGPLAFAAVLAEYGDTFRLAVGPQRLVGAAIAGLGFVARRLGRRAHPSGV
jgi:mannose-6-phosphate isomerase-like protein (cupin superfamily)